MFSLFSSKPARSTAQLLSLAAIGAAVVEAYNNPEQIGPEMAIHIMLNLSNTYTLSKEEDSFLTDLLSTHLNIGQLGMLLKGAIDGSLPYSWLLAGGQAALNVFTIGVDIFTCDYGDDKAENTSPKKLQ